MSRRRKLAYLVAKQRGICYLCHGVMGVGRRRPTIDHKYPRAKGGTSAIRNLKAACYCCNNAKGCLTLGQYRELMRQREAA